MDEDKKELHDLAELRELGQLLQQAKLIDGSSEDVLNQDNDDENVSMINDILETIKLEKAKLRDEASIIRGELSQAMTKENLRKIYSGEQRKEQQKKEEYEWKRQQEVEKKEKEDAERKDREEMDRQRKAARDRLFNGVLTGSLQGTPCTEEPGPSGIYSSKSQLESTTYGYESEYENAPMTRSMPNNRMLPSKSLEFHAAHRVQPVMGAKELLNGHCGSPASRFVATSLSNLNESRNSQDSGLGRETVSDMPKKQHAKSHHEVYGDKVILESEDETPRRPTMLCFGRWKGSGPRLNGCIHGEKPMHNGIKSNGHFKTQIDEIEAKVAHLTASKSNGQIVINKNVKETAL
ncbi:unnamed protein product, partial [Mesorhabditis spiculigera]